MTDSCACKHLDEESGMKGQIMDVLPSTPLQAQAALGAWLCTFHGSRRSPLASASDFTRSGPFYPKVVSAVSGSGSSFFVGPGVCPDPAHPYVPNLPSGPR